MARTIGNPLSWSAGLLAGVLGHAASVTDELGSGKAASIPQPRTLSTADLREALRRGIDDFTAMRTDVIFLILLYPVIGLILGVLAIRGEQWHLLFPVVSGFALIGPFAAVGLYEMSRQREQGHSATWQAGFNVLRSPAFGAVFMLGLFHIAIFAVWIAVANFIWAVTLGPDQPASVAAFLDAALTTPAGWAMVAIGVVVGLGFAAVVLACSVVSFPLMLDRHVGLPVAVVTSVAVARRNPVTIAIWGLIVAGSLALASLPLLLGLVIVLPVLGHATWHLYRKALPRDEARN